MLELRREQRFGVRKKIKDAGGLDKLSENEAKEVIEKMKIISKEKHKIRTEFFDKIDDILSYKKILKLEISEHEFDRKLFRKFRGARNKQDKKRGN